MVDEVPEETNPRRGENRRQSAPRARLAQLVTW